jgi:aryl-alcohol dehydrogenase-like predicted oxidoreductase
MSLRRLAVDRIDLWQLHRIDPAVPSDEQFGVIRDMQDEGLIRHVGLSEVTVDQTEAARGFFDVVTVQNLYNIGNRQSEALLEYCEKEQIGFIPWFPLGARALVADDGPLAPVARRLGATPSQVAVAWLLHRSSVMLPIPGTGSVGHVEENCRAATVTLDDAAIADLAGLTFE